MPYVRIVYSLTGLDEDEQEMTMDVTDNMNIAGEWFNFCYSSDIIRRVVMEKDEE